MFIFAFCRFRRALQIHSNGPNTLKNNSETNILVAHYSFTLQYAIYVLENTYMQQCIYSINRNKQHITPTQNDCAVQPYLVFYVIGNTLAEKNLRFLWMKRSCHQRNFLYISDTLNVYDCQISVFGRSISISHICYLT